MKSPYLLSAFTALAGFGIAWFAKPTPAPAPVVTTTTADESPATRSTRSGPELRPSPADRKKPKEVNASDFPLADQAALGPKTRDEAKMLRLTEALGLSIEQQGEIISLIEKVQAAADPNATVIQDLTVRGKAVEEGLAKLLTPEQLAKFEEIRVRERENRIEQRAQQVLTNAIAEIDLSPEQREQVLSRLRQKSRSDLQAIPAAATLLFDKSMLPTSNKELSVDGVLLLAKIGEEPPPSENPGEAVQKVIDRQRAELEEILECFDGVLTPGQMGQYQAAIAETKAIMSKLPKDLPEPDPTPDPAPQVIYETVIEEPEETEEE